MSPHAQRLSQRGEAVVLDQIAREEFSPATADLLHAMENDGLITVAWTQDGTAVRAWITQAGRDRLTALRAL